MTASDPTPFTERVRSELGRMPLGAPAAQRAELAALLRSAGTLHLTGASGDPDRLRLELVTTSGAVVRRVHLLLGERYGLRPELSVQRPGGMRRRSTYGVSLRGGAQQLATALDLLDAHGRPVRWLRDEVVADAEAGIAYLRGAFLAAGSVSAPGRAPHLEFLVTSDPVAHRLAALVEEVAGQRVGVVTGERRARVVAKSGDTIGVLLRTLGATDAYLAWEEQQLRRSLRNDANRLANADAANVRRAIDAARAQVVAVEAAVARVGWLGLGDDLRAVALARLANPSASLAELGQLCDPPLHKSAVYRRLRRLEELARSASDAGIA